MPHPDIVRFLLLSSVSLRVDAFCAPLLLSTRPRHAAIVVSAKDEGEPSNAAKGVWFATEIFGKIAALAKGSTEPPAEVAIDAPGSLDEAISRLERDYEGSADDPRPVC